MSFWNQQRKGANCFNRHVGTEWWQAASRLGLEYVRLAPDKAERTGRDFLIGNADAYKGIDTRDFDRLRRMLDDAHRAKVNIALTLLSLPGARWSQMNDDRTDPRLWSSADFQKQAADCWHDLAARLKGHPALVGYDPLNEPHPARALKGLSLSGKEYSTWHESAKGTPADLNAFNRSMVKAIRAVDPKIPILLESDDYGSPEKFPYLDPINDPAVLYSFHYYAPYEYTSYKENKGKYAYPERMPVWGSEPWPFTSADLNAIMEPVATWAKKHNVPANRIIAAEFGCERVNAGATSYLRDVVKLLNGEKWHWAFYSYREDTWAGMDYEVGTIPLTAAYWDALSKWEQTQKGTAPMPPRKDNPLFNVLKKEFRGTK